MGTGWIVTVLQALQEAGIRAQRGFPAEKMPYLTGPVVGISLDQLEEDSITLSVRVYAPVSQGGPVCEDVAAQVLKVLNRLEAQCTVESGSFDGATGLFCVPVKAKYEKLGSASKIMVYINKVQVPHLVSFSARYRCTYDRLKDLSTDRYYLSRQEYRWYLEIEDILEQGTMPCGREEPYTVYIVHSSGTWSFLYCFVEELDVIPTPAGTRRIRKLVSCGNPVENIPM